MSSQHSFREPGAFSLVSCNSVGLADTLMHLVLVRIFAFRGSDLSFSFKLSVLRMSIWCVFVSMEDSFYVTFNKQSSRQFKCGPCGYFEQVCVRTTITHGLAVKTEKQTE